MEKGHGSTRLDSERKKKEKNDKLRENLKHIRQNGEKGIIRKGNVNRLHNGDEEKDY